MALEFADLSLPFATPKRLVTRNHGVRSGERAQIRSILLENGNSKSPDWSQDFGDDKLRYAKIVAVKPRYLMM